MCIGLAVSLWRQPHKNMRGMRNAGGVNQRAMMRIIGLGGYNTRGVISGLTDINTHATGKNTNLQAKNRNPRDNTHVGNAERQWQS